MYPQMYGQQQLAKPPRGRVLVTETRHAVLVRNGVATRALPPGRHRLRRGRDRLWYESATPQVLIIPSQEVLTADGITVRATVGAVVTVTDPLTAMRAGDWRGRLYLDIQLALRLNVTSASLEDLVANRAGLDTPLLEAARESAGPLGVEVGSLALRDLVVPGEQRRLLAEVVAARLAGQASLERARAETAALRSLANAASMVRDNPALYQLRLLQEIASSEGNTFVVGTEPLPGIDD